MYNFRMVLVITQLAFFLFLSTVSPMSPAWPATIVSSRPCCKHMDAGTVTKLKIERTPKEDTAAARVMANNEDRRMAAGAILEDDSFRCGRQGRKELRARCRADAWALGPQVVA
mmetsp:Transcript_116384/g.370243  ORF Transcript_116384/g.370243 Transcript_116384/m.370243 type:complete len:114 (-) Transcript_116384:3-344(-)